MNGESVSITKITEMHPWQLRLEQVIRAFLWAYIASLPFRQLLIIERNGFLVLLGMLVIWSIINRRIWFVHTPLDLPLIVFVSWVGLTIPFASFPDYSLKEFGKLLQGVAIFYAVVCFLNREREREWLIYLLAALVAIVSAAGIFQFDLSNYQKTRSFLSSEVWLTTFLVMFLPLCWAMVVLDNRPKSRPLFLLVGILAIVCLLFTQSRAGFVALVVEAGVFAWLYRNRALRMTVGALVGLAVIGFAAVTFLDRTAIQGPLAEFRAAIPFRTTTESIDHRLGIWSFTLSEVAKHPIVGIGYGPETLRQLYPEQEEILEAGALPVRNVGTHNIFLYLALHVGLPGLLLFLWLAGVLVNELIRCYNYATRFPANAVFLGSAVGVIGLLVRLQFDQMFVGTLAILFWVLVASAIGHSLSQHHGPVRLE